VRRAIKSDEYDNSADSTTVKKQLWQMGAGGDR